MVLQNIRVSNGVKPVNCENTPPPTHTSGKKGLATRITKNTSVRRRARTSGSSTHTPTYRADQAKRRSDAKPKTVKFKVTTIPTVEDVEMGTPVAPKTYPISLPRELARPVYKDVSLDTIYAAEPELTGLSAQHILESLDLCSPDLMRVLNNVKVDAAKDRLPKELTILSTDMSDLLPTHMLAVFGRAPPPSAPGAPTTPRKVTLYPTHSLVLLANCAHLPPPPAALPTPPMGTGNVTVPVWNLCVPAPMTFPHLSVYIYSKNQDFLLRSFLPVPAPATLLTDPAQVRPFAASLAATFTVQALMRNALTLHGLWQNVCALGVFDDKLWEAMDVMWAVLLTALAIATGEPSLMLPTPSATPAPSS